LKQLESSFVDCEQIDSDIFEKVLKFTNIIVGFYESYKCHKIIILD
jgi:hypothetical protein